jgi:type II secretory pathway pseudopilin PulG
MTGNKVRAYATECEAALGTVRTALRVYQAEYKSFPTLANGAVEGRVPGINANDLDGTYFSGDCYTIVSAATLYTITCTWNNSEVGTGIGQAPKAAQVNTLGYATTLNQDGTFTGPGH